MKERAENYLRTALGDQNAQFRTGQWEAIEKVVSGKERLLLVQRTGWGKSIVYFIATRLLRDGGAGPTLLISPLLSLMRNQIEAAGRINIRAATVNSSNTDDWDEIFNAWAKNSVDILLVSPERLANSDFMEKYLLPSASGTGLFVVDEAHCISDWGHDFRPDYRRIVSILNLLPKNIPVLTTTATANDRVVDDVVDQLGSGLAVSRGPLRRKSLRLQNIQLPNQAARMAWLADQLPNMPGSGIIYTLTTRDADRVAEWLRSRGINAKAYHSRLKEDREALEQELLGNKVKALVATTALGMGFDKPDLGFVIHFQRPGSVVHYYQQVGRAGRQLDNAYGILLCGEEDDDIIDYFIRTAFPPEAQVNRVLKALENAEDGLGIRKLEAEVNLGQKQIEKILKILAVEVPSPIVKIRSRWYRSPGTYEIDTERIERLRAIRRGEQRRMQEYVEHDGCLMKFLATELSDPDAGDCGKCAGCIGEPILPETYSREMLDRALQFLKRSELPIEPRKQWPTGFSGAYEFSGNIKPALKAEEGRALCMWGDPGWGDLVRNGKRETKHFDDRLVDASAEMIRHRWRPEPFPTWVTCVPSLNLPELVPDFAIRLAGALDLPFRHCILKIRDTVPQKEMENSFHQARNLDGAFEINSREGFTEPVLLVDDMVDSRWTLTVLTALLRREGSGPVFPFALAVTTKGS